MGEKNSGEIVNLRYSRKEQGRFSANSRGIRIVTRWATFLLFAAVTNPAAPDLSPEKSVRAAALVPILEILANGGGAQKIATIDASVADGRITRGTILMRDFDAANSSHDSIIEFVARNRAYRVKSVNSNTKRSLAAYRRHMARAMLGAVRGLKDRRKILIPVDLSYFEKQGGFDVLIAERSRPIFVGFNSKGKIISIEELPSR